jgi:hypothetical protein
MVSALGSAVLAVSMFLPWYSVSITPTGAAEAQQQMASVAQQYGNANLQAMTNRIGARFSSLAGHPLTTVSAHQALKAVSVILLLLAAVALVASLLRLADVSEVGGAQIALVGFLAVLLVLFRMFSPPSPATGFISLSPSWGSWVALMAAAAIVVGALWTPSSGRRRVSPGNPLGDLNL